MATLFSEVGSFTFEFGRFIFRTLAVLFFRIWSFYFPNLAALFSDFGRFCSFAIWRLYFPNLAVFFLLRIWPLFAFSMLWDSLGGRVLYQSRKENYTINLLGPEC